MEEMNEKKCLDVFTSLSTSVSQHTQKKDTGKAQLTYLSWAKAWELFKQKCPTAQYEIKLNEQGLPYFASPLGIMVFTKVTVGGLSHEMWLSVMDGANRALKAEPYTVKKQDYKTKQVTDVVIPAATMNDINRTLMRCLTKNLAMFGLGLHVYEGEDLSIYDKESMAEEQRAENKAGWLNYINTKANSVHDLNYAYESTKEAYKKDDEIKTALLAKAKTLVQAIDTYKALGDFYKACTWAQTYPEFTDMFTNRKIEIEQSRAEEGK